MTWDNRSKWQIDYDVPFASFSFEAAEDPGFLVPWALSNLRPLWSKENYDKRTKRMFLV